MFIWYRNSFLASVVSIAGCGILIGGIAVIAEGDILPGIAFIAAGLGLCILARVISGNKSFKKWWKQVTDANLEGAIARDADLAVKIYNKNPQNRTLKKIEQLNPAAADFIRKNRGKK